MTSAIWFRNDLRIEDNPALRSACASGKPVIAFYVFTPKQLEEHFVGELKQRFILESVASLSAQLDKLGIPLIVENGSDYKASVTPLMKWAKQHKVEELHINKEVELNELRRDNQAQTELQKQGIATHFHDEHTILPPGSVVTEQGTVYKVFSAFKRNWLKQIEGQLVAPLAAPKKRQKLEITPTSIETILSWVKPTAMNSHWEAGAKEAKKRLKHFVEHHIHDYKECRDIPSLPATSQLSPYLAVGAISAKTCAYEALLANDFHWDSGSSGITTWLNEIIWREFYKHLTYLTPSLCKGDALQTKTHLIPWLDDKTLFNAWATGNTGYPIVDAGMRQLNTLGWMHNRLRMITAMFLTKHLFINWRMGEKYFMEHLIDGDFSANNGGWQWSASTGADAAPYFRIFNPERQSLRFDKDGLFIKQWVPELAGLEGKAVHNPSPMERELCGYPHPLVNHAEATQRTKDIFQSVNALEVAQ